MDPISAGILGFVVYFTVQLVRPEKPLPAPKLKPVVIVVTRIIEKEKASDEE